MEVWQEALKVALIGTERQAPTFTPSEEPISRLLAGLNAEERERTLLRAGGLLAAYRRAGYRPKLSEAVLPAPAEPEEKLPVPDLLAQDLMVMLGGEYRDALPEWLQGAADRGWRIPEEHLVELLEFGRGHPEIRNFLLPLLGKRGRWLAAQNPEWKYALQISIFEIESALDEEEEYSSVENIWQTGTKEERTALVHGLRRTDPAQARALVESTWKQDAAAERAEFLSAFASGLSMEDEPFLESALDDKRKEVRVTAQDLLLGLPESRLCRRMWERIQALVRLETSETAEASAESSGSLWNRLRTLVSAKPAPKRTDKIVVTLPEACDKTMIRDGIEAKVSYSGIGEKTWWLTQMLQRIPLSLWSRNWERTPAEIVAANLDPEWQKPLLDAWTAALRKSRDLEWAPALFASWLEQQPSAMTTDTIWQELLPNDVFEAGIQHLLDRPDMQVHYGSSAFVLLSQHKTLWSPNLTRAVLTRLVASKGNNAYYMASMMSAYTAYIPDEFRAEFFEIWSKLSENNPYLKGQIDRGLALDAFRNEMRRKMDAAAQEN